MWRHRLLSPRSIFCYLITKLLTPGCDVKRGSWPEPATPFFQFPWKKRLGWEERAPTEDSIGTAEILAGL